MKLTEQDQYVLLCLDMYKPNSVSARRIAHNSRIRTSSPSETAARHLIKLTKLGLAEKTGTRVFPEWRITTAGLSALKEQETGE